MLKRRSPKRRSTVTLRATGLIALVLVVLGAARAQDRAADTDMPRIMDRTAFMGLVSGRTLSRAPLVRLEVVGDGTIEGRGAGLKVTGNWHWEDGYFCRDLFWAGDDLGYNCQEVRSLGTVIRFTSDKGQGDFADFRLR